MKTLYTEEQFSKTKSNDKLPLECEHCGKEFLKRKAYITAYLNGDNSCPNKYCSKKCANDSKNTSIEVKCKQCEKTFFRQKCGFNENGNNFCTKSCGAVYNNAQRTEEFKKYNIEKTKIGYQNYLNNLTEEEKEKRKAKTFKFICPNCKQEFTVGSKRKTQKYCSKECFISDPSFLLKQSKSGKKLFKEGKIKGWSSRTKLSSSYAEKFFEKALSNNKYYKDIDYTRELKVDKYFIDFAFVDKKIALEIDGKQHLLPERIASDKLKDECLEKNGWYIIRIPWKSLRKEENKVYIKQQIDNLLERLK